MFLCFSHSSIVNVSCPCFMPVKGYTFGFVNFVQCAPYGKKVIFRWPSCERETWLGVQDMILL